MKKITTLLKLSKLSNTTSFGGGGGNGGYRSTPPDDGYRHVERTSERDAQRGQCLHDMATGGVVTSVFGGSALTGAATGLLTSESCIQELRDYINE